MTNNIESTISQYNSINGQYKLYYSHQINFTHNTKKSFQFSTTEMAGMANLDLLVNVQN